MIKKMYDYLDIAYPDVDETLDLGLIVEEPLVEDGDKNVIVHEMDNDTPIAIILSEDSIFFLQVTINRTTASKAGTVFDMFHDSAKGCGRGKTFMITHPTDSHTYVGSFANKLSRVLQNVNIYGFSSVLFRIWGKIGDTQDSGSGTCYVATKATEAFCWIDGENFSQYSTPVGFGIRVYELWLTDASDNVARGYIGEEGEDPEETLGSEELTDSGLEAWDDATHLTSWDEVIDGSSTVNREDSVIHDGTYACRMDIDGIGSYAYIKQSISYEDGALYKVTLWAKSNTTGSGEGFYLRSYADDDSGSLHSPDTRTLTTTDYVQYTFYFTAASIDDCLYIRQNNVVSNSLYIDDVSVKKVTDPPNTEGVKIYSTKTGSTQSWAYEDSGFDPNDIASWEIRDA